MLLKPTIHSTADLSLKTVRKLLFLGPSLLPFFFSPFRHSFPSLFRILLGGLNRLDLFVELVTSLALAILLRFALLLCNICVHCDITFTGKASLCSSQDHEWIHDPTTKQLVSKVPGANSGSTVCAQIGGYANHYSLLSAVDCAPANAVPKNQQWEVDALNERVSIDVRFDATQQRSPGQLLCFDVDMGATPSGKVGPGSKLLSQVWAKKQPGGAVAVLIINADNSTARNVGVTMASLGLAGKTSVTARDVWAKKDLPDVDGPTFTAIAIPPQDSRFLLFK